MSLETIANAVSSPIVMLIAVSSLLLAVITLALWKKHNLLSLLYAHLFFAIIPFVITAVKIKCSPAFQNSFISFCTMLFSKFVLYFLPALIIATFILGYFVVPRFYLKNSQKHNSKQFQKACKKTKILADFFVIDRAKPEAYTVGKNVFMTVGMFEILNSKEREAVILHELNHVKSNSSWIKFNERLVRIFSPVAWFSSAKTVKIEEQKADNFAKKIQGSPKFVLSAKNKIQNYSVQ